MKPTKLTTKLRIYTNGRWLDVDESDAPADLVRLAFPNGPVYVPAAELLAKTAPARQIELQAQLARLRDYIEDRQKSDAQMAKATQRRRKRGLETAAQNRRTNNDKRDAAIRAAYGRFEKALSIYGTGLPSLLEEFGVPRERRSSFKIGDVARALAESRKFRVTSAAQIRNILKAKTR